MRLFQASAETLDETFQMVLVTPLTPQQIQALQNDVWEATNAGDPARLKTAIQAAKDGGADLNCRGDPYLWGLCPQLAMMCELPSLVAECGGMERAKVMSWFNTLVVVVGPSLGFTPILIATWNGDGDGLAQLIRAGANVNRAGYNGVSPCWVAARNGNEGCLAQLIAAGADVNTANNRGSTPLKIATEWGKASCVELLREAGARE